MADKQNGQTTPTDARRITDFLKQNWLPLVLIVVLVVVACVFRNELAIPSVARSCIVFILAGGLLIGANRVFFPLGSSRTSAQTIPYVISFDCATAIIVGLAATVLACNRWEIAFLLAGSCLLIGGFFGLLFGYPQGVAQQNASSTTEQANQRGAHSKNLVADSAATLGKVITGFTLAKLGRVATAFSTLCTTLGPALGGLDSAQSHVLAGVIVAYFLATGFLSGLFLPTYFMSDHF
jgi:hypothetical protein